MIRLVLCVSAIATGAAGLAACGESEGARTDATTGATATTEVPPGGAGRASVAVAGDIGIEAPGLATLDAMAKEDADVYLAIGDLSYAGPDSAGEFCDLVSSRVGEAPFELLAGNHEEDTGEDGRIAEFAGCLPDRLGATGEYARQYYVDLGRLARLIMISPDLTIEGRHYFYGRDDDGSDTAELAWLKEAIGGARDEDIQWVIVAMHKNCISVGQYYCDVYQDLFSTLIDERVDLVLSGHDHSYQRSKQIAAPRPGCHEVIVDSFDPDCVVAAGNSYERGAGSAFVISGAGGAELYPLDQRDPEARYFVAAMGANTPGRRYGFTLLEITPERLRARFVASSPGSFRDSFEIVERAAR
jgi:hypothetical protein